MDFGETPERITLHDGIMPLPMAPCSNTAISVRASILIQFVTLSAYTTRPTAIYRLMGGQDAQVPGKSGQAIGRPVSLGRARAACPQPETDGRRKISEENDGEQIEQCNPVTVPPAGGKEFPKVESSATAKRMRHHDESGREEKISLRTAIIKFSFSHCRECPI